MPIRQKFWQMPSLAAPIPSRRFKVSSIILALAILVANTVSSENIFAPYLKNEPPEILETVSKEIKDGIEITKFKFLNRVIPGSGEKVIIYGILARPMTVGKHPAMLVCHGGGGCAMEDWTSGWAKDGYVALSVDEPGICNLARAKSSGPWNKYGWKPFKIDGDATRNMLFDGVVANLNALNLLRSRPDVDKERIGIVGVSWGGYMTTIISGIAGNRIKASFCIYGCGYYDIGSTWKAMFKRMRKNKPEEVDVWLKNLDAGRWASKIKSSFFSFAAANDWYFWLPAFQATYNEIKSPKRIAISPNSNHQLRIPGCTAKRAIDGKGWDHLTSMEIQWMGYYLKGEGKPFTKCLPHGKSVRQGGSVKVFFKVEASEKQVKSSVWYSYGERSWRNRYWRKVEVEKENEGVYSALIPVNEPDLPINWFALVSDVRDISVSTTVQELEPWKLGFNPQERTGDLFKEDFESTKVRGKWRYPFAKRFENAKFHIHRKHARSEGKGLGLAGKLVLRCDDLRGESLKRSGAKGLSLWGRSLGGTGFDIQLMAEDESGNRHYWVAPVKLPRNTWEKIDLTWDKFEYAGSGGILYNSERAKKAGESAPFTLLSKHLSQFRIATPEKADIYIDDINTIK